MKTISEINSLISNFEKQFGFKIAGAQQGSDAWFKTKLGVISASNAYRAIAKVDSDTRLTYMAELVGQVCTGIVEEVNSKHMDWGNQHEDAARAYYEFTTGFTVTQLPFVFKDTKFREGCSPDGLVNDKRGTEIKCPYSTANYIKFLLEDTIKPEWRYQYQYTLRVLGADEWDFSQYDPRMLKKPMKTVTVYKDDKIQKLFDDMIPPFIADMDEMLKKIGVKFGDQWARLKEAPAEQPQAST